MYKFEILRYSKYLALIFTLIAKPIFAFESENLFISGFGTVGYSQMLPFASSETNDIQQGVLDNRGTFKRDSLFGINTTFVFNDKMTFYGQLVSRGSDFFTNEARDYSVKSDMLMLSYRPVEWLDIRVGRQVVPTWMVSQQLDVGLTYLWIRPPQEVYQTSPVKSANAIGATMNREFFGTVFGLGAYWGDSEFQADVYQDIKLRYVGVGYVDADYQGKFKFRASAGTTMIQSLHNKIPYLKYQTIGYFPDATGQSTAQGRYLSESPFFSLGLNVDYENVLLLGEYANLKIVQHSLEMVDPTKTTAAPYRVDGFYQSYYATLGYRLSFFTPHITYSYNKRSYTNFDFSNYDKANATGLSGGLAGTVRTQINTAIDAVKKSNYPDSQRETWSFGLNFWLTPSIVSKFEYQTSKATQGDHQIVAAPLLKEGERIHVASTALSFAF